MLGTHKEIRSVLLVPVLANFKKNSFRQLLQFRDSVEKNLYKI